MKKLLVRLAVGVIVVVTVTVVVGYLWMDSLAKAAVERGGTYAMGVDTTVNKVSLSPFSGQLTMEGLKVANPKGFTTPHLMDKGSFDLALDTGSLLGDSVHVTKIHLKSLDLNIDQQTPSSNISTIMDNIKKLGGTKPADPEPAGGKKFRVDLVVIENVSAHVKLLSGPVRTINIPRIELKNLTSDDAAGVALPVLVARILPAIVSAVIESGQGLLPPELTAALRLDVASVAAQLGGRAQDMIRQTHGGLTKAIGSPLPSSVTDTVGKMLGGAKAAGDANRPAIPAGGLLDGILGGKKK